MDFTSTTIETVKNLEHKFTKANESIEQTNIALKNLRPSWVTGAMLTILEDDSSSFMPENNQTSLSYKCLQNDSQQERMKQ